LIIGKIYSILSLEELITLTVEFLRALSPGILSIIKVPGFMFYVANIKIINILYNDVFSKGAIISLIVPF